MSKVIIVLVFVFFFTLPLFAQDTLWSRTYGSYAGEDVYSAQKTMDGGYILSGEEWSSVDGNIYLIKTNSVGDTMWTRSYGGNNTEESYYVQQTIDGGYIVTGYTESFGAGGFDVYLIKTDSLGNALWARTYGNNENDVGYCVQQTKDGGYIVVGKTRLPNVPENVYLIKTNSDGDTLWTRVYGGDDIDYGFSVRQTEDGGYIVAGGTESFVTGNDAYLVKTDSLGGALWSRTYAISDAPGGGYSFLVQQSADGGYIMAGSTSRHGSDSGDVFLIKTNSFGDPVWSRRYGGSNFEATFDLQQTTDGGYIVVGITLSFDADSSEVYILKTDSLGGALWTRIYGGDDHDYALSVQQTLDGGYVVVGETRSFGMGSWDVMLTKLDPCGNTCIGKFVSSTDKTILPAVTSPPTAIISWPTIVTSPLTEVSSPAIEVITVCEAIRGNANGDEKITISDVVFLINYLFKGGPSPNPVWVGDVNCDCQVTISDVVYLINYLFKGGPPPAC